MHRLRMMMGLAVALGTLTLSASPALAHFFSKTGSTTGKAKGTLIEFTQSPGGDQFECAAANEGKWEIQEAGKAALKGKLLDLAANLEGSPVNGTTTGNCAFNKGAEKNGAIIKVKQPVKVRFELNSEGELKVKGKLVEDVTAVVELKGFACTIKLPAKGSQGLRSTSLANSGGNLAITPDVTGISTEAKGSGCAFFGFAEKSNEGAITLLTGGSITAEGVNV